MYKLSQVAEVVGINARTLSDWLDRGIIPAPRSGKGNHRSFSSRDVDRVAIVNELTRIGLPVAEAAKAASAFSDERSVKRPRGQLYGDDAKTLLVITQDGASVHRAYDQATFESAMEKLFADEYGVVVLNVSATLKRVDAALAGSSKPMPPTAAIFRHGKQLHVG